MNLRRFLGLAAFLCWTGLVLAMPANPPAADAPCTGFPPASVHCGRTPSPAVDANGRLWVVYAIGETVQLAWSEDAGRHFADPVRINDTAEAIYTNGENRPKLAFGPRQELLVSWTAVRPGPYAGDIRFTRSLDGGRRFEPVRTINDDGLPTSHRFETLAVTKAGEVYLVWLDKRDQVAGAAAAHQGAAVYYAASTDGGRTFGPNRRVAGPSCECCRIAATEAPDGGLAVFWRHLFAPSARDHAMAILGPEGVRQGLRRVTQDDWQIDACPHHGPAMIAAADGGYHLTWFTLGNLRQGIHYAHYLPGTGALTQLRQVAVAGASHPQLARSGERIYLAWKHFDGDKTRVKLIRSTDEGGTWSPPEVVAATASASDHPLLLAYRGQVWLCWHSAAEGLRLIPLE